MSKKLSGDKSWETSFMTVLLAVMLIAVGIFGIWTGYSSYTSPSSPLVSQLNSLVIAALGIITLYLGIMFKKLAKNRPKPMRNTFIAMAIYYSYIFIISPTPGEHYYDAGIAFFASLFIFPLLVVISHLHKIVKSRA